MPVCMICGVPTGGRTVCADCARKRMRLGDFLDRARADAGTNRFAYKVEPTVSKLLKLYEAAGVVKPLERVRPPKPPRAKPLRGSGLVSPGSPRSDEDEYVEIDVRRFRNVEQGGV